MVIFSCVILAVAVIGFTLIVREKDIPPAPMEDPELRHLQARRQVLYENLKDLQFEYHQGKLSEQDYQSLKQNFLYDMAVILDSIELRQGGKSKDTPSTAKTSKRSLSSEKEAGRRATLSVSVPGGTLVCPACQSPNASGSRFCGQCGQPLSGDALK